MSPRTLRLLELPAVLKQLEGRASSEPGRTLVRLLEPSTEPSVVRLRLDETSQARAFLAEGPRAVFAGVTDVSRQLQSASIGSILEPSELLAVCQFAGAARRLRDAVISGGGECPLLLKHATAIKPSPAVEEAVAAAIDDATGEVKDRASLDLLRARRNIRQTQNSIQSRLRDMLSDTKIQSLLQDSFVSVRDGRYCLPVKADCRGQLPGIVHDRSGSGGAFFVEPQAVVDLNNRLREHQVEEREAVLAVLRRISQVIGEASFDLSVSLRAVAALDLAFAKAELAASMNATAPRIAAADQPDGYNLLQARHPLVDDCVPNDICLASDLCGPKPFDVMLITGPNTGGKTVVLKTLGLLTCMAGCGLLLPVAAGSSLALPGAVYADIGDEQSIAQSLSTFSSHLKQIVQILNQARSGDLVLLDEIGAGTDPDEGAALAKSVLRALQRRGVHVVATTHYGELKQFALSAERFVNASVEFDSTTLRPTYRLRTGVPGASNALEIAARLGMPPELVQRARRYLGPQRAESEAAAQKLEEARQEAEQETAKLRLQRQEVERTKSELQQYRASLEADLAREIDVKRRQVAEVLRDVQAQGDAVLRELRQSKQESKQTEQARQRLRTVRDKAELSLRLQGEPGPLPASPAAPALTAPAGTAPVKSLPPVGSMVRVAHLGKEGVLLRGPDASGQVEVRVGAARVRVNAVAVTTAKPSSGPPFGSYVPPVVPEEINLIGKTSDEALLQLEQYLDGAMQADMGRVRVVHGKGTGALRSAIHRWLKRQPGVSEFHLAAANEGGDGATLVELK